MKPQSVSTIFRFIDYAMFPLMKLISLAPFERPQESHAWHAQKLNSTIIHALDLAECVTELGDDTSYIKKGAGIFFHIPLIGGWRHDIVLEVASTIERWNVGWIVRDSATHEVLRFEIQKLPLFDQSVRLLVGPKERVTTFFAVNKQGEQLPLRLIGKGRMGDGSRYGTIRLF